MNLEMAGAKVSLERFENDRGMQVLVEGLSEMQREFTKNGELLLDVIGGVDTSYADCVIRLSTALGHIQFQDVMRQRMEHVQEALVEMCGHLELLANKPDEPDWDGELDQTFKTLLDAHLGRYRMASQAMTHLAISGDRWRATTAILRLSFSNSMHLIFLRFCKSQWTGKCSIGGEGIRSVALGDFVEQVQRNAGLS